jgi:dephospho-CoA kinase
MKKVIVLTGDLASGKSSLADSLSLALAIPAFKKDIIKERYCDLYGYTTREENRALSIKATDYMIDAFK